MPEPDFKIINGELSARIDRCWSMLFLNNSEVTFSVMAPGEVVPENCPHVEVVELIVERDDGGFLVLYHRDKGNRLEYFPSHRVDHAERYRPDNW